MSSVAAGGGLGAGALAFFTGLMGRFQSDWRRHPGGFHEERDCGARDIKSVASVDDSEGKDAGEGEHDRSGDEADGVARRGASVVVMDNLACPPLWPDQTTRSIHSEP